MTNAPAELVPERRCISHFTGGWMGPWSCLHRFRLDLWTVHSVKCHYSAGLRMARGCCWATTNQLVKLFGTSLKNAVRNLVETSICEMYYFHNRDAVQIVTCVMCCSFRLQHILPSSMKSQIVSPVRRNALNNNHPSPFAHLPQYCLLKVGV